MILLQEMFKKHPHNLCFFIRGLALIMKKSEPLIIKVFGQGFYAVLSFTGQQYNEIFFVPLHPNYKLSEKEDDKIAHFAAYAVCAYGIRLAL